jgi:hypothetical protein
VADFFSAAPRRAAHPFATALLLVWAVGLFALRWSFSVEAAKLVVAGPGRAEIERGPPLRRRRHALDRLKLRLVETEDSDAGPYFHLVADAPEGPLILAEGYRRAALAALQGRIEQALAKQVNLRGRGLPTPPSPLEGRGYGALAALPLRRIW